MVGSSSAAPTSSFRQVFVMVAGLTVFGAISIDMYLPAFPQLADDFGATASQVQLTLTAFFVGFAAGQLVAGPISDVIGRRRPLLAGIAGYVAASVACAFAGSIEALVALRSLQGFFGAAGVVLARAIVRDFFSGVLAAKLLSRLMIIAGVSPILAPLIGGAILRVVSWRGIFVALSVIGVALLVKAARGLRESLPPERRRGGGLRMLGSGARILLSDRVFLGYGLGTGCNSAALFAFIAGASFCLQDIYGLSPAQFSLAFAAIVCLFVGIAQVNAAMVGRVPLRRMLGIGNAVAFAASAAFLATVLIGGLGLAVFMVCAMLLVAPVGVISSNALALAMTDYPELAGTASALIGVIGFASGAIAAPIVGIAGRHTAVPMALTIFVLEASAFFALTLLARPRSVVPVGVEEAPAPSG